MTGKTPQGIEIWSDAAGDRKRRNSSSPSPERLFEIARPVLRPKLPKWVEGYLDRSGSLLKQGGWEDSEVEEIVHVLASGFFEEEAAVLDILLLKADRFSDTLRRAGWSSEEVSEALGFDFLPERDRRPVKKLSSELEEKIGKLAEYVSREKRISDET
ncbi:hypothetical protein ACLOJK_031673 [Asimina triloba]